MTIKLSEAHKKQPIVCSDAVADVMQQILKRENKFSRGQEHFWVVGLNTAHKILFIELVALGRQNRVMANPPDVFRMAIHKLAVRIILVHNTPTNELNISARDFIPSPADIAITDRLLKVGEIIHIEVLDHLIISETQHHSFADDRLIEKMKASDSWRVLEKEEMEMKEMRREMEMRKVEKDKAVEIAREMKDAGMEDGVIKKMTGLSLAQIRKL